MKKFLALLLAAVMALSIVACGSKAGTAASSGEKIATPPGTEDGYKVGLLFSTSGTTATTDMSNYNGATMAVDEINAAGGINGKPIIPLFEDYGSDPAKAADKIKKLILKDEVVATVGCLLSSTRQACMPIVEEYDNVLFYPVDYEGQEQSPNIFYMNVLPNQQITEFIPYIINELGKTKFYLIGSDFVFSTLMIEQAKPLIEQNGGQVVGEELEPFGYVDFASSYTKIRDSGADVIFSLVCGDSEIAFYKQHHQYGFDDIPICAPCSTEMTAKSVGKDMAGNYSCRHYFNTYDTETSKAFVEKYNNTFKDGTTVNSATVSAYDSVYLLKAGLEKLGDNGGKALTGTDIVNACRGITLENSPAGSIYVDPKNNHAWVKSMIAKADENGVYQVIKVSDDYIEPKPFAIDVG